MLRPLRMAAPAAPAASRMIGPNPHLTNINDTGDGVIMSFSNKDPHEIKKLFRDAVGRLYKDLSDWLESNKGGFVVTAWKDYSIDVFIGLLTKIEAKYNVRDEDSDTNTAPNVIDSDIRFTVKLIPPQPWYPWFKRWGIEYSLHQGPSGHYGTFLTRVMNALLDGVLAVGDWKNEDDVERLRFTLSKFCGLLNDIRTSDKNLAWNKVFEEFLNITAFFFKECLKPSSSVATFRTNFDGKCPSVSTASLKSKRDREKKASRFKDWIGWKVPGATTEELPRVGRLVELPFNDPPEEDPSDRNETRTLTHQKAVRGGLGASGTLNPDPNNLAFGGEVSKMVAAVVAGQQARAAAAGASSDRQPVLVETSDAERYAQMPTQGVGYRAKLGDMASSSSR